MIIIGWIVWAFVAFLAITFPIGIYGKFKKGEGVQKATIYQTIAFIIIAIVFLLTDWNKLHIIWVAALSFIIMSFLAYSIGWRKGMDKYRE